MADDRLSVWLCITALCVGGAEQTLVDLANGLDRDRYDVTVWTIFETGPLTDELATDVTVRSMTDRGVVENGSVTGVTTPLAYVAVVVRFCYAAAVECPDVVHSFLFFDNMLARLAGVWCPATVVTGVRSVPEEPDRLRAALDRLTVGLSDRVVSNSENGADLAVDRGAAPDAVSVVRNGRDVATYRDATAAAVEAELDIDGDELVVGTVGRVLERKGHFELVTAWADLQRRRPDARLLVVGDGEDRAAIEAHAREQGCADSVQFLGTRRDVPQLLAAMDVFAFPSHFEGLPGAVVEAMAAGLPVVATPVDGTAELLEAYRTGLFVRPKAPAELAWALTRLLDDPELREALGTAAQREAEAAFDIDTMVANFEALYREVGPPTSPPAEAAESTA